MAIRAFLSTWQKVGNQITTPLLDYLNDNSLAGFEWMSTHYPSSDAGGVPVRPVCLTLVKATDFAPLAALSGVDIIPSWPFNTLLASFSTAQRNAIYRSTDKYGVERALLDGAGTYGKMIKAVVRSFEPAHEGFGAQIETEMSAEFG